MEKTFCYFADEGSHVMVFRSASAYHVWIATIDYDPEIRNIVRPRAERFDTLDQFKRALEEFYRERAKVRAFRFQHPLAGRCFTFDTARALYEGLLGLRTEGLTVPDSCLQAVEEEMARERNVTRAGDGSREGEGQSSGASRIEMSRAPSALDHWGDVS